MQNLNAEQIKKALKCCYDNNLSCIDCPFQASDKYVECAGLTISALSLIKELTEDNERLRDILLQFTDIVHKWGNKNGYDTTEISLVSITYEANKIKSQIEADTVRKMQERLKDGINEEEYTHNTGYLIWLIDQIAKEMLEGKDEIRD